MIEIEAELLTAEQLAGRLHVKPNTVRVWTRRGRIPAVKLSPKVVRYEWAAVLAALRGLPPLRKGAGACA
jgi:predicted site-specific integrase-resolvase